MPQPIALNFPPGIQRDGTRLDAEACLDGLWSRFRLGRPRKMGGYHLATKLLGGTGRRIHMFYKGTQIIIHVGTSATLDQIILDRNGNFISHANRTPATFGGGLNVGWSLDALFDTTSSAVTLMAHAVPDLTIVANGVQTPVFSGIIDDTTPLSNVPPPLSTFGGTYTPPVVASGVVCIQPFVFDMDRDGFLGWSAPNNASTLGITGGTSGAGNARASAQKIITGLPLRGGGSNSPAALFWSLSEVITANFVGTSAGPTFAFNTVSPSSSILSAQSVIEYDGLYFWAGIDRFLVYNGTVVELPNSFNQDYFFDNMNWDMAGKAFVTKVPHFGEIWFCAPLFGATEPNYAAIYNVREQCWYDTMLPNGGRTAGYFAQGVRYPVMSSPVSSTQGKLWLHEYGMDQTGDGVAMPIRSYIETPLLGGPRSNPPSSDGIAFQQLEPDIKQTGDMVVWAAGSWNARAGDFADAAAFILADPQTPQDQLVGLQTSRRLGRLHFESYTLNGSYVMGRSFVHADKADAHKMGGTATPSLVSPTLPSGAIPPPLTETTIPLEDFLPT
jgi:hypothetical protein